MVHNQEEMNCLQIVAVTSMQGKNCCICCYVVTRQGWPVLKRVASYDYCYQFGGYRKLHTVTACMHVLCFYSLLYSLLIAISLAGIGSYTVLLVHV